MQSDQPGEQKERSKKDRKGKKNKNKRDKGSKGKGKRKGKGKGKGKGRKGSRKKKHEESGPEDGFLRVSTTLPEYLSQEPFQPTELPEFKKSLENKIPAEALENPNSEMPTHEPKSATEAPTVVPSVLPESEVTEEVDKFTIDAPHPDPSLQCAALTSHSPYPPNRRVHPCPLHLFTTTTNQHHPNHHLTYITTRKPFFGWSQCLPFGSVCLL